MDKILTYSPPSRVNRQAHIIHGVSVIQAVEALGHHAIVDTVTLQQTADFGNGAAAGIKSRFTHPGLSADGLGKFLGRARNFYIDGDHCRADLHLSDVAAKSPHGNLREYVESLAEEDPAAFGMSIVFTPDMPAWLVNGEYINSWERPENAANEKPFVRLANLSAVDVVDEPAANRSGLFSAAFTNTSNTLAANAFALADAWRADHNISLLELQAWLNAGTLWDHLPAQLHALSNAYAIDRQHLAETARCYLLARIQRPMTGALSIPPQKESKRMEDELTELQAQLADLQAQLAERAAAEAAAVARVADLERTAREQRLNALIGSGAEQWPGDRQTHLTVLRTLTDAHGEDSQPIQAYARLMNGLTAQLNDSALLDNAGTSRPPASAAERLDILARERSVNKGLTYQIAYAEILRENPELYAQFRSQEG